MSQTQAKEAVKISQAKTLAMMYQRMIMDSYESGMIKTHPVEARLNMGGFMSSAGIAFIALENESIYNLFQDAAKDLNSATCDLEQRLFQLCGDLSNVIVGMD